MKKYTIGILFSADFQRVLLIHKTKPEWQAGKLNFPGGKIEPEEVSKECVAREFLEETQLNIPSWHWQYIGQIENYKNYFVDIYTAILNTEVHGDIYYVQKQNEEYCVWSHIDHLPGNIISNLSWLVPFALNVHKQGNVDQLTFGKFTYKNF